MEEVYFVAPSLRREVSLSPSLHKLHVGDLLEHLRTWRFRNILRCISALVSFFPNPEGQWTPYILSFPTGHGYIVWQTEIWGYRFQLEIVSSTRKHRAQTRFLAERNCFYLLNLCKRYRLQLDLDAASSFSSLSHLRFALLKSFLFSGFYSCLLLLFLLLFLLRKLYRQ